MGKDTFFWAPPDKLSRGVGIGVELGLPGTWLALRQVVHHYVCEDDDNSLKPGLACCQKTAGKVLGGGKRDMFFGITVLFRLSFALAPSYV